MDGDKNSAKFRLYKANGKALKETDKHQVFPFLKSSFRLTTTRIFPAETKSGFGKEQEYLQFQGQAYDFRTRWETGMAVSRNCKWQMVCAPGMG